MDFQPQTQQMPQAPDPVAKKSAKKAKLKSIGIPVLAGLIGLSLGSATAATDTKSELEELRTVEQTLSDSVQHLRGENSAAIEDLGEAEAERDSSVALVKKRDGEISELQAQIEQLQAQVKEVEAQAVEAQAATEAAAALNAVAPAPVDSGPAPEPIPFAAPPAPEPVPAAYYANCTAARNAGAAPVYAGDPGYGRHLDRDGDGVGCES